LQQDEKPQASALLEESEEMDDKMSELSSIPTPAMEKHLIEVENLKWQIEYERKLQQEMNSLLENKVSALMADKEELQKQI